MIVNGWSNLFHKVVDQQPSCHVADGLTHILLEITLNGCDRVRMDLFGEFDFHAELCSSGQSLAFVTGATSRLGSELPRYPSLFVAGLATGQITAEYASILLFCFFPKGTHERLRVGCNGRDSWNYFGKRILDSTGMTLRSMENGTEVLPKKLTRREPEGLLLCGSPKHWVAPVYCTGGRRGCRSSRFNFFAG